MSATRRFDASGIRRGLRQSIEGGSGAAAVNPFDELYARHPWAEWWDGPNGLNAGAGTWTDRVQSAVLTCYDGASFSAATLGGVDAVRVQIPPGGYYEGAVADPPEASRWFFVLASAAIVGSPTYLDFVTWSDYAGVDVALTSNLAAGWISKVYGTPASSKGTTAWDDGSPRVIRREYTATHASHVLRINGVAQSDAVDTGDAAMSGAASGYVTGSSDVAIDFTAALIARIPIATIDDTQAAQVETDLLTIMGL